MVKSDYPYFSWKDFIKLLSKYTKIKIISQRGSHIKILKEENNKKTIIPNHKKIAYWTFSAILKQIEIDENDFLKFLK